MNSEDQDYAGLLKALRETPDPVGTEGISVDRAVQDGRRTVRRRRVVGGLAVVALIAAACTSPLLLNAVRDRDDGAPVAPAPGTVQPFSIWSQAFEAGSAGGFTPSAYRTGRYWQQITMLPASAAVGDSWAAATMLAPGFEPGVESGWAAKTPIEDIAGQPAFLLGQAKYSIVIAWQYAANSWGMITMTGPGTQLDRARHIAESVHRGIGRPVTVPFTVSRAAIGSELEVTSVSTPFGTDPAAAGPPQYMLNLDVGNGPEAPGLLPPARQQSQLTVGISKVPAAFKPTTTVGGRPAEVNVDDNYARFELPQGYIAVAEQSPVSSYTTNFTAIAASVKLTAATGNPLR
ncbi:hypothetical protein [Kribbella sp. NPDC006257]|uniref:hypothetical protein n=1 Tax=Kribbella sp. NPDC006257 TaxID=3156738 RepID=UPI0033AF935C